MYPFPHALCYDDIHLAQVFGMASGHINPSLPLARRLVSEGHKVSSDVEEIFGETISTWNPKQASYNGWKWLFYWMEMAMFNHFLVDRNGFLLDRNGDVQPSFSG